MTWLTVFFILAGCLGLASFAFSTFTILMWFAFHTDRRLFATWRAPREDQPEHATVEVKARQRRVIQARPRPWHICARPLGRLYGVNTILRTAERHNAFARPTGQVGDIHVSHARAS